MRRRCIRVDFENLKIAQHFFLEFFIQIKDKVEKLFQFTDMSAL